MHMDGHTFPINTNPRDVQNVSFIKNFYVGAREMCKKLLILIHHY